MIWIEGALGVLFAGAFLCLATAGRPLLARRIGPSVTVIGCLLGIKPVIMAFLGKSIPSLHLPWNLPFGSFIIEMDALSAVFAAPILVIAALTAIYGMEYLKPFEIKKDLSSSWFFFNILIGSMLVVVMAKNAMLFLLAWEIMSLASFFLVIFENEKESVRHAGWTYLVATHIGTAFLLALFILLGRHGNILDFNSFSIANEPGLATTAFLLAVIGFGTKAGFMPLHVWLPEAHPAAPSHVSAIMSGVMIKTGIYGLIRILTMLGTPPPWWGWMIIGIGAVSGILGVLFALAQHDLKRLLAYHSVENIGIIALGIGIGMLGISYGSPVMAFFGFAGSLLHVINHAVFKSLLFMSAGSVLHASGTREIEHLGGMMKSMPVTALVFLVGSVAICGLPPLNGFVSEFMIYFGSFTALAKSQALPTGGLAAGFISIGSLALIGGLAVACFTKAFGVIFLGEPRSTHAIHTHEAGPAMKIPMIILAIACVIIGLSGPFAMRLLASPVEVVMGYRSGTTLEMIQAGEALRMIAIIAAGILLLSGLLALIRARILSCRSIHNTVTWDCGYAKPTPRMQYTASSFADPITRLFRVFLKTRNKFEPPNGLFPASSSFSSETPDVYRERMYKPVFSMVENILARFRWLQHGRLNLYILCIVLGLIAILVWKLR